MTKIKLRAPDTWEQERSELRIQLAEAQKENAALKRELTNVEQMHGAEVHARVARADELYDLRSKLDCTVEVLKLATKYNPTNYSDKECAFFITAVYHRAADVLAKFNAPASELPDTSAPICSSCEALRASVESVEILCPPLHQPFQPNQTAVYMRDNPPPSPRQAYSEKAAPMVDSSGVTVNHGEKAEKP